MLCALELVYGPLGRPLGGLAWDGGGMLVCDTGASAILRWDPVRRTVTTARKYTNRTHGIAFGPDGVLYGCQSGSRRIVRFLNDGSATTTATRVAGRVHNHPHWLAIDRDGRVWFSDPHRSELAVGPGPQRFPPLDHRSVLRLSRTGPAACDWHIERMTLDTLAPAGVALSPDERTLYVAESDTRDGGARELRAYPIAPDGSLGNCRILHVFGADHRGMHRGIDGMCVDTEGNVVACAGWQRSGPGPLVYVFSPTGTIVTTCPVPADLPVNCAFGDDGLDSLYVTTAAGHLFRARSIGSKGYVPHCP
jgi:gluconolactonase